MMKLILISGVVLFVIAYIGWHNVKGAVIFSVAVMIYMYLIGAAVSQEWPKWKDK